jgi:O-antigen ligase
MRRVVRVLLLAFVFAVPWEYSLDLREPLGNIARMVGLVLLMAAIPAVLGAGRLRTPGPLQWLVLAIFAWSCCTCFWTIDHQATVARLRAYFQVMMPVWLIWEFAETPRDLRDLLRAYVAGSWVLAVLTIASLASQDAATQIRFVAEGQDPNDVARFLDLGFPMSALLLDWESRLPWKLLALGYLPVGLVGVLLTASRGGFVAAVVALAGCGLLLVFRHPRTVLAGALSLPAIAAAFWFLVPHETIARISTIPQQLQRGDLNQRLNIWSAGWKAFVHAPFYGAGVGTFVYAARLAPGDTAHNTALTTVVEGGIIALILASAILAVCVRSVFAARGPVRIALGTALLVWLVTSAVATVEANRTTWLLMGLLCLAGRLEGEEPGWIESRFPGTVPEELRAAAGDNA